jgi:hypothetical protein
MGRIDIIKRLFLGVASEVQVCINSTEKILNFILESIKFSVDRAICHVPKDINNVMAMIKHEAKKTKWATFLEMMVCFILKQV